MKVLMLDDHPLILSALRQMLEAQQPGIEVAAAETPEQAKALLAAAGAQPFDLLLLDLKLGDEVDGFDVLAELRQAHPELPVAIVSATERLADVVRAVDMGAMGFVPKRSSMDELSEALSMVLAGGVFIPPALLELIARMQGRGDLGDTTITAARAQLAAADAAEAARRAAGHTAVAAVAATATTTAGPAAAAVAPATPTTALAALAASGLVPRRPDGLDALGLTPRQTEVLALLLKGLPNKLIARELNLSVETVKDHVAAVLRALEVNSRTQAVLAVSRIIQRATPAG
ncbi:response regulator transcription factor [Aquabacterium sp. OR-4]|uniref:response regulator transcription factor n=1 Tax=Aquabacterium sp. OR-4 TaxID=2978127 RepID=UPI0021B30CF9|nr:response regulator transcription factor [Aquabacterium sp. OR-4]MDT7835803.1 response regulator transcription factor [Aquabacterium sp. OR-4]